MMKKILLSLFFSVLAISFSLKCQAADSKSDDKPVVVMETTLGDIKIELFPEKAPITVKNFLAYVESGFYDGLIFHRVIPGFVIQGGGFEPGMKKRTPTRAPIANEATNGLKNKRGTLSMARTMAIHSATSQFFVNVNDNVNLDHRGNNPRSFGYAVFAKVISGMNVVDKIVKVPRGTVGRYRDVPQKDVIIKDAYVVKDSQNTENTDKAAEK